MTDEPEDAAAEAPRLELAISDAVRAGVWANWASVSHSPFEFTIDFARLEFMGNDGPSGGVVVSRISLSPLFVSQLIDALQNNWTKYVAKAMLPEVNPSDTDVQADIRSDDEAADGSGT